MNNKYQLLWYYWFLPVFVKKLLFSVVQQQQQQQIRPPAPQRNSVKAFWSNADTGRGLYSICPLCGALRRKDPNRRFTIVLWNKEVTHFISFNRLNCHVFKWLRLNDVQNLILEAFISNEGLKTTVKIFLFSSKEHWLVDE